MKTLLLYRHAKTATAGPGVRDRDRRLLPIGETDAIGMGVLLAGRGLVPDVILTSDAARARQTAELCAHEIPGAGPVFPLAELYEADGSDYPAIVAAFAGNAGVVMVVGHNPAMEEAVGTVASRHVTMKTGSVAVVESAAGTWGDLAGSDATLKEIVERPRRRSCHRTGKTGTLGV